MSKTFSTTRIRKAFRELTAQEPIDSHDSDLEGVLMILADLLDKLEDLYSEVEDEWRQAQRELGVSID